MIQNKMFLWLCVVFFISSVQGVGAQISVPPPPEISPGTVLIKWRDLKLTKQDFDTFLAVNVPVADQIAFRGNIKRIADVLDNLQVQRTLAEEAIREGVDKDPEVARELAYVREKILAKKRLDLWEKNLKLPDFTAAAEEYYKLNTKEFMRPEMVRVQHVLISNKKRSMEEAQKKAEEIRSKALAGEDFSKLADEYSEDPSVAQNHGDMGFFPRGRMVQPFEEKAFSMTQSGEISEPVETSFGYHVIRFKEKKVGETLPFDEVKERIVEKIKKDYINDQRSLFLKVIREDKTIELNNEAIETLYVDTDSMVREALRKQQQEKESGERK